MRYLTPFIAALALLSGSASAQDLMGFDPASFGQVVLSQKQFGSDTQLELAVGDYNNEFINNYSAGSVFAQLGLSVGRLDILTDTRTFPCTAFLVGEDLLMTNHHCVPGILDNPEAGASAIVAVQFMTGYVQEGVTGGTERYNVNPIPVETSKDLDYTLLRVIGAKPGKQHGTLRLAGLTPRDKDPYWIIGHPMGEAQRVSREKCAANAPALSDNRLLHTCDTLPGNSGSPVIDASSHMVVALHHAGSRQNSVNYAIPMALILENSTVLRAANPDPSPQPDPEAEAMTALSVAMAQNGAALQIPALRTVQTRFPGTRAAASAGQFLALLVPPAVDPTPAPQPDPEPVVIAQPEPDPDPEAEALTALSAAMDLDGASRQIPALRSVQSKFPGTKAASSAAQFLSLLVTPSVDPTPQPAPQPEVSLVEQMAKDADVQQCDRLAGSPGHPDWVAGIMTAEGTALGDVIPTPAIAACKAALETFPDHPRMLTFLGRAFDADQQDTSAVQSYQRAADQGEPVAQNNLGVMYRNGRGVPKSDTTALSWYRKSADQGNAFAQNNMGFMYENGHGVPKSDTTAVSWYRKAAEQGNALAQNNIGLMYENGRGVPKSDTTAVSWYRLAAEQGYASAQTNIGYMYAYGRGLTKSETTAVSWYRKAAEQDFARAQTNIGYMYENGLGVPKSGTTALSWYRKAAEQGYASAQANIGFLYANGRGVPKSDTTALSWFRKAADQGHATAQYQLGIIYEYGRGVAKSDTTAVSWYRKAADQGNAPAQNNMGVMYAQGRGVPKSNTIAISWYRKAADQGNKFAQFNLGFRYANGSGVPQSDTNAVAWYRKAAEQGHATAQVNLGFMYEKGRGTPKSSKQAVDFYVEALRNGNTWVLNRTATDWDAATAREMQRRLSALVFYDGAIDGKIGPQSLAAMRKLLP